MSGKPPFSCKKFVEVQIVVAYDKLNVYIRQLRLHVGSVLFRTGC